MGNRSALNENGVRVVRVALMTEKLMPQMSARKPSCNSAQKTVRGGLVERLRSHGSGTNFAVV